MNVVLWIVQALLAATYVIVGSMKAVRSLETLSKRIAWVRALPAGLVLFIGIAEVLGAIGLILPMVTNIAPWLTVAAAAGLVLLQVCAIIFHVFRHETRMLLGNIVLLLAAFVLVGRVAIVPLA
jgi:putative oxidoreductase